MPILFPALGNRQKAARLDVRADDTDSRDYIFAPSLTLLPEVVDPVARRPIVVQNQGREGACVGFALAAVINASLLRRLSGVGDHRGRAGGRRWPRVSDDVLVSERMLYEMARRYDEWKGESYEGTSLRGAMKGWHKHGVCSRRQWPYDPKRPGHLKPTRAADAQQRPLGAYYRIVDSDVSHLQAAVVEGDAVLASAWIRAGWGGDRLRPASRRARLQVKRIPIQPRPRGLHAFAIIGYGPEGFLVQNSWGERWGTRGLAVLSYEDWMENRQDAWVARPGPRTLDARSKPRIFLDGFMGRAASPTWSRAGTSGAEGLEIDPGVLPYLINTWDRGALSTGDGSRPPPPIFPTWRRWPDWPP